MMSCLKTWLLLLHGGQVISPPECHFAPPTVAEGFVSDHAAAFEGGGAAPSVFLSSPGVGVSSQYKPGFCSSCQEQIATALDIHMMNLHLLIWIWTSWTNTPYACRVLHRQF